MKGIMTFFMAVILLLLPSVQVFAENNVEKTNSGIIRVGQIEGKPGNTVSIDISLEQNPGIVSLILHLSYDNSAVNLYKVRDTGILGESFHNPDYDQVPYVLSWMNDTVLENITNTGTIATLDFWVYLLFRGLQ